MDTIVPTQHSIDRWQEWAVETDRSRARRRLLYAAHHGVEIEPPRWVREASERNRLSLYRHWHGWIIVLMAGTDTLRIITCYRIQACDRWEPVVGNRDPKPKRRSPRWMKWRSA